MNETTPTPPPVPDSTPDEQPTSVLGDSPAQSPAAPAAAPGSAGSTGAYPPPGYQPPNAYPAPGTYPPPASTPPPGGYQQSSYAQSGAYGQSGGYGQPAGYDQSYGYPQPAGNQAPGPYPPPGPGRRLHRSRSNRVIGGVCGGLARYWNTDATLLRILTVVLTLATGGAFLVGYLIAWIAIPDEPMRPNPFGSPADEVGYAAGGNPSYADYPAEYIAPAPRERSYLGWLVLSAAILAAGILGLIGFLLPASAGVWGVILGVALAILGIGMLVGAKYGRARWLLWFAIPLAFITFATVSASNFVRDNPNWDRWVASTQADGQWGGLSLGERVWAVEPRDVQDSPLEYRLSAGSATLDLTELTARGATESTQDGQRLTIDAGVGLGELIIVIPGDMQLDLTGSVDVGQIDLPQQLPIDRSNDDVDGTNLDVVTTLDPVANQAPAYIVTVDAAIGAGNLEVRREAA